ncbi:MAG: isoprenylcysteine carboxylmethyltransferase family protein [Methanocellales archaeon]|nr:isoprenylcysteine carboxylmethyltransferase family protein [Methanocellales archaeon]MDD3291962.1 isoprenylcysteine carboxylmethyltransferase family protein [Methanocellales archaeon]MDD5235636.1 isoprenylcysteine carboxylmethyltransferase family protein [Methanocellales archaeon]
MEKREGNVRDLVEKLQRGELTSKETLKKLKERKLTEGTWGKWEGQALNIFWIVYFVLWLPLNFTFSGQLLIIHFPAILIYLSIVLLAIGTFFSIWGNYLHRTRGGLEKIDEAIILYKEGAYRIIRHPQAFGFIMWPILLPVILSSYVPFTILSIAAIITMIVYLYYGCYLEEKLDIEKWGDEYRQYIKEVPRFNFILGLWNLRRKGE